MVQLPEPPDTSGAVLFVWEEDPPVGLLRFKLISQTQTLIPPTTLQTEWSWRG